MSIFLKLLPIILISIIFYILIYNLYPKYQELIDLTKKLNQLQNKEKEMKALEKLIKALSQNPNIQQLINNKEVLDLWLPQKQGIEDILASLVGIYNVNNLVFEGADFTIVDEPKVYNQNVLPVKIVNLSLTANLGDDNLINFVKMLEQNTRLMVIKKARISLTKGSDFVVESYYLYDK